MENILVIGLVGLGVVVGYLIRGQTSINSTVTVKEFGGFLRASALVAILVGVCCLGIKIKEWMQPERIYSDLQDSYEERLDTPVPTPTASIDKNNEPAIQVEAMLQEAESSASNKQYTTEAQQVNYQGAGQEQEALIAFVQVEAMSEVANFESAIHKIQNRYPKEEVVAFNSDDGLQRIFLKLYLTDKTAQEYMEEVYNELVYSYQLRTVLETNKGA